jgi:hypothetical protein
MSIHDLVLERYLDQLPTWPEAGRHVLAQFDEETIVVYQAYRPAIAEYAVDNQRFGGEFSFSRMSWIKPNFLWMMFRSGWAQKEGQERVLGVRLERAFFERCLASAVASSFDPERHASEAEWKSALATSDVRLQWDPDHDPSGAPVTRRAVQLGLRGATLKEYATTAIVRILDVTDLVARERANARSPYLSLITPRERELPA